MTADELEARFWEWRPRGRQAQTLFQDLSIYLTAWMGTVGWQTCSTVYSRAMKKREWDIEQGGLVPPSPMTPRPPRKKGGLIAY